MRSSGRRQLETTVENHQEGQLEQTGRAMSNQEPTPNASPVKLGHNHKLFMTKLQVSPTKNSNNNNNDPTSKSGSSSPARLNDGTSIGSIINSVHDVGSPRGLGRTGLEPNSIANNHDNNNYYNNNNSTMNANSSRVINSLHDQVDTLTDTNLELTKQSHNLLNKLENVQINETKLMEDLSHLKNANELVNNELSDSTIRLKHLEEQLSELKMQYNNEIKLKLALERQIKTVKLHEDESLKDEVLMRQSQYDTMLVNQQNYKELYTKKINDMTETLEAMKIAYNNNEVKGDNDEDCNYGIFGEKLNEMEKLFHEYAETDKKFIEYVQENKLQTMINDNFKLEDWIQLHKDMNETFNQYVEKMDIPDAVVDKLKHELHIANNNNNNNGKPVTSRIRHTSGSIISNGDAKDKRRSYYGSLRNGSQEHINISNNDSTLVNNSDIASSSTENATRIPSDGSMSLPGVKKTSSVRRNPSISRQNKKS